MVLPASPAGASTGIRWLDAPARENYLVPRPETIAPRNGSRFAGIEAAGVEGGGPPGSLGGGGGDMSGSRVERAGGGPPGDAPRPLRRPEGQGVTDGPL